MDISANPGMIPRSAMQLGIYVRLKHRITQTSWVIMGYSVIFEGNAGQPSAS